MILLLVKFLSCVILINSLPVDKNAELTDGYFEGDMILTQEQIDELFVPSKSGFINKKYRWRFGIVPYQLLNQDFGN